jgi:hypothetical protein
MNRLPLAQVTLCAVDCEVPALAALALLQAQRGIAFGRVVLFTRGWLPTVVLPELEVVEIEPLPGRADLSDFVARRLHAHIATSHALLLRWDAGVLNPTAWTDEFLVADYLAPPSLPADGGGLPGISMRSRRWLRAGADPRLTEPRLADADFLGTHRGFLETAHGVQFAPEALQPRFAATDGHAEAWHFGFVGAAYLPAMLGEAETIELVRRLPSGFLRGPQAAAFEVALQAQGMPRSVDALQRLRATAAAPAPR